MNCEANATRDRVVIRRKDGFILLLSLLGRGELGCLTRKIEETGQSSTGVGSCVRRKRRNAAIELYHDLEGVFRGRSI